MNASTYISLTTEKGNLVRSINQSKYSNEVPSMEAIKRVDEIKEVLKSAPTVNVSFMVGYQLYYRSVVKIGKTYFDDGRKMTKSNGFWCIEEIPEITEKMTQRMIEDSYSN